MIDEGLLPIVVDTVAAYVSHNKVIPSELPSLIGAVYTALDGLGKTTPPIPVQHEPAVPIRSSVKPDAITCLECGVRQKMLKRHLSTYHDLTPIEYKARWSLNAAYPLVASDYSATRRDLALKIGLGRKTGARVKPRTNLASGVKKRVSVKRTSVSEAVEETA